MPLRQVSGEPSAGQPFYKLLTYASPACATLRWPTQVLGNTESSETTKRTNVMKTKDLMTIATVALGTATLTVMAFWSDPLGAGNEGSVPAAMIGKPKLVSHGVEMTLTAAESRTFKAGDEPRFDLTAINTTRESAAATICVEMTASSPADMLSRVPRLPSALWREDFTLALKPNETRVVPIAVPAKLPANRMIAVSLRESKPLQTNAATTSPAIHPAPRPGPSPQSGILALNFSTAVPLAQTVTAK